MAIKSNIEELLKSVPAKVRLVAVSKTRPVEDILEAYYSGQRIFAENKAQELALKYEKLPKDIEWHMIGHLQTNKVKYIAPFVSLIHAVDSLKLLEVINKEAIKNKRIINFMFQLHIAKEETKFGLSCAELEQIIDSKEFQSLANVGLVGLMGMATFTDDAELIRSEFLEIKSCFDKLKNEYFCNNPEFCELSIGMSSDYKIAIEAGSTMVRIGTSIFGYR
jgi:pyridoxal phosphate enzyme (YggS family)